MACTLWIPLGEEREGGRNRRKGQLRRAMELFTAGFFFPPFLTAEQDLKAHKPIQGRVVNDLKFRLKHGVSAVSQGSSTENQSPGASGGSC